jgi:hypothetical protein
VAARSARSESVDVVDVDRLGPAPGREREALLALAGRVLLEVLASGGLPIGVISPLG